jgi:predicted transcriptional regulator
VTHVPRPTTSELEILQVLWEHGPLSVRAVRNILNQTRDVGYTSVLKIMQIMADKGLVDRDTTVRPQLYKPCGSKERTQRQMLADLMERAYGGSIKALVLHAIGDRRPSPKDIKTLERILDKFEGD